MAQYLEMSTYCKQVLQEEQCFKPQPTPLRQVPLRNLGNARDLVPRSLQMYCEKMRSPLANGTVISLGLRHIKSWLRCLKPKRQQHLQGKWWRHQMRPYNPRAVQQQKRKNWPISSTFVRKNFSIARFVHTCSHFPTTLFYMNGIYNTGRMVEGRELWKEREYFNISKKEAFVPT